MNKTYFHGIEMPTEFFMVIRQFANCENISDEKAFLNLAIQGAEHKRLCGK